MTSNLNPVSITDKNGKRTTVHRKSPVDSASSSSGRLPPPWGSETYKQKLADRQELRDRILELAVDRDSRGPNGEKNLARTLTVINSSEFLQKALDVAAAIRNSKTESKNMEFWRFAEDLRARTPIEDAHRDVDLIRDSTKTSNSYSFIGTLRQSILDLIPDGEPRIVEGMREHLLAYNILRTADVWGTISSKWDVYAKHYEPLVSAYPDHVEKLCAYLLERGGVSNFSEDGFKEYLNTSSPLSEGSL
jgi:hypothetical protein